MDSNCNHEEIKYSFLKDYFDGEPSDKHKDLIASWFEDPEYRYKFEHCLKEVWKETEPDKVTSRIGLDVILDRIHHKINLLQPKKLLLKRHDQKINDIRLNTVLKNLSRVAAILLLPLMAYLGWEAMDQRIWEKSQAGIVYNEFYCPLGVRSRFELPDGTSGWLNNGSRLKYPIKFLNDYREVELIGEAYFDVSHHKGRPFIINTDGLDVKVLGTKLNVYAYPDEKIQTFTLETGSVELIRRNNGEEVTVLKMKPGQHAVYSLTTGEPEMEYVNQTINKRNTIIVGEQTVDKISNNKSSVVTERIETRCGKIDVGYEETSRYTDWKSGKLVLRNDPMPIMLNRIGRWYNVRFDVNDERINEYRYWATFEEENLDQVLKALSLTGPIMFEKQIREQKDDGSFKIQEIDVVLKN